MSNKFDNFNVKSLKKYFKNKPKIKKSEKVNKPKIKKPIKNLTKKASISLISLIFLLDHRVWVFIIVNLALFYYYKHFCNMVDKRAEIKKQKLAKYKKQKGVLKRMANLKQFN